MTRAGITTRRLPPTTAPASTDARRRYGRPRPIGRSTGRKAERADADIASALLLFVAPRLGGTDRGRTEHLPGCRLRPRRCRARRRADTNRCRAASFDDLRATPLGPPQKEEGPDT